MRKKLGCDDLKVKEMLKWVIKDTELQISLMERAVKDGMITHVIVPAHKARGTGINLEATKLAETF